MEARSAALASIIAERLQAKAVYTLGLYADTAGGYGDGLRVPSSNMPMRSYTSDTEIIPNLQDDPNDVSNPTPPLGRKRSV